jgi:actin-related protein
MPYGGDELTRLFLAVLRLHHFPYAECDLARALDFDLMDDLKVRLCTLDEDDISSQIYEAYVRHPGQATKVYPFKIFEERIIVPSALFESHVPLISYFIQDFKDANAEFYTGEGDGTLYYALVAGSAAASEAADGAESLGGADVPSEGPEAMETNSEKTADILSVEEAVVKAVEALDPASNPDRLKKFLGSLLVIGNGHKFPRLVAHLDELLRTRFPGIEIDFVLGGGAGAVPVKENLAMDAGIVAWKGGAVYAKLECTQDAWISRRDYDTSNRSALRDRLAFTPALG